ncbi:GNAT family N-acetyltransferase [Stratiformator vulcanicus]|uniref:N-acetyltransferase domain-containing protein n=1 Tax=Stratiformator vulcanicus TaxID=2527980 RepID=A0A517QWA4_9PLAN|nr:GNAT family N-acetyltransferase [Stratiformator vulcanicus]QDT35921.1 hypothetical protein Pan189_02740 [Stratiformator vulcanicus]
MPVIRKITADIFPNLYRSFLASDDPLSTERDWRNIFDYAWPTEEGHCGYAMLEGDDVVGMIGMVFIDREIDGVTHKFCNLHTWWVREDYRGRSLSLLRPVLSMQGYTITHFTPCDKVRAISKRLGFEEISTQLRILPALNSFWHQSKIGPTDFLHDPDAIAGRVNEMDRRILTDHQPYNCEHLLFSDSGIDCYLLYTQVVRHRVTYCHIHHCSNWDVFKARETEVRRHLIRRHGVRFVAVDTRLAEAHNFRSGFDFWAPVAGLYKSDNLSPGQIDNLYSDIVFLKLTTLPTMKHELLKIGRRFLPTKTSQTARPVGQPA